jgi:hypothetical protein
VGAFPWGQAFVELLTNAGLVDATSRPLTLGVVYLYNARRPDREP